MRLLNSVSVLRALLLLSFLFLLFVGTAKATEVMAYEMLANKIIHARTRRQVLAT